MGELHDQLKKYLKETPKEEIDRHFFEFECHYYGIDENDPCAKHKIKRKHLKEKWIRHWPRIIVLIDSFCCSIFFLSSGSHLERGCFGLASIELVFGILFIYKTVKRAKELW